MHKTVLEVNIRQKTCEVPFNKDFGIFSTFQTKKSHNNICQNNSTMHGKSLSAFPHILFEQFRTVNLQVPETRIILAARLLMLGFTNCLTLSTKIIAIL